MRNRGFIGLIIIVIIALALINYFFGWSIFEFLNSEKGKATVIYTHQIVDFIWSYVKIPVMFLWQIVVDLFKTKS